MAALASCPELRHLEWNCPTSDKCVADLVLQCPKLTSLSFEDRARTYAFTDRAVIAIARCLPSLTSLMLGGRQVSDCAVKALVKGCPKLTDLGLNGYIIESLPVGAKLYDDDHVQRLNTVNPNITDHSLVMLADLPRLLHLDVTGCPELSFDAFDPLFEAHEDLQLFYSPQLQS